MTVLDQARCGSLQRYDLPLAVIVCRRRIVHRAGDVDRKGDFQVVAAAADRAFRLTSTFSLPISGAEVGVDIDLTLRFTTTPAALSPERDRDRVLVLGAEVGVDIGLRQRREILLRARLVEPTASAAASSAWASS